MAHAPALCTCLMHSLRTRYALHTRARTHTPLQILPLPIVSLQAAEDIEYLVCHPRHRGACLRHTTDDRKAAAQREGEAREYGSIMGSLWVTYECDSGTYEIYDDLLIRQERFNRLAEEARCSRYELRHGRLHGPYMRRRNHLDVPQIAQALARPLLLLLCECLHLCHRESRQMTCGNTGIHGHDCASTRRASADG